MDDKFRAAAEVKDTDLFRNMSFKSSLILSVLRQIQLVLVNCLKCEVITVSSVKSKFSFFFFLLSPYSLNFSFLTGKTCAHIYKRILGSKSHLYLQ